MQAARSAAPALLATWFMLQTPVCALAAPTAEAIQALGAFNDGCQRAEALRPARLCGSGRSDHARGGVNNYASPTVQALDDNPDSQGIKAVQDGTSAYYVISRQSKHWASPGNPDLN